MADPIRRLVQELSRLPGIGEKSATRLAFHLIRGNRQQVRDLAYAGVDGSGVGAARWRSQGEGEIVVY